MGNSGRNRKKNKKKDNKVRDIWKLLLIFFKYALAVLSSLCVVLVFALMPFYFQEGYNHIGSDKSYFFRTCIKRLWAPILTALAGFLLFYIIDAVRNRHKGLFKELFAGLNPTDFFAFFYGLSVILSYLCTNYKETALWGTKGWYMGMIPQLTLVSVYALISLFQLKPEWMLWICMPVSTVIFLLGYLNRFDIWPLEMSNSGLPLFISTIGNINWYCGYVVTVMFVGVGLLWLDKGEKRLYTILLSAYVFLGFATLITQGSDSGIFATAVVFIVLFVLSARDENINRIRRFWLILILFAGSGIFTMIVRVLFPDRINYTSSIGDLLTYSPIPVIIMISALGLWFSKERFKGMMKIVSKAVCIVVPLIMIVFISMIILNTTHPGSLGGLSDKKIFCFDNKWGSSRGASWSIGLRSFTEQDVVHKLTGIGPDCMADFLYADASQELMTATKEAFKNKRLTNSHCELLTILVNEGVLGAAAFAGMMASLLLRLLKAKEKNIYAMVCGLCLLAYLSNNIWSFQQSMSVATIFVIMGLGERCLRMN